MGVTVESLSPTAFETHYRQAIAPTYLTGSFLGDDADNHDFKFKAGGKGRMTIAVSNPCNQALTAVLYGMHVATGTVGDAGTHLIGTIAVTAAGTNYDVANDPYPYYLVRVTHALAPTDTPKVTVNVYVTLSAY